MGLGLSCCSETVEAVDTRKQLEEDVRALFAGPKPVFESASRTAVLDALTKRGVFLPGSRNSQCVRMRVHKPSPGSLNLSFHRLKQVDCAMKAVLYRPAAYKPTSQDKVRRLLLPRVCSTTS